MKLKIIQATLIILMIAIPSISFAHSLDTGGESVGYSVDSNNHAGTSTVYYMIDSLVSSTNKTYTNNGAARWGNAGSQVKFTNSCCFGAGTISQYSGSFTDTLAKFTNYKSDSNGHLVSWFIRINNPVFSDYSSSVKYATMAHEFGHAVGLNDLYWNSNTGKLCLGVLRTGRDIILRVQI